MESNIIEQHQEEQTASTSTVKPEETTYVDMLLAKYYEYRNDAVQMDNCKKLILVVLLVLVGIFVAYWYSSRQELINLSRSLFSNSSSPLQTQSIISSSDQPINAILKKTV